MILTLLLVPTAAMVLTLGQQSRYEGSAEVLLSQRDLAGALTGIADSSASQPDRVAKTQAGLARVPAVVERTLRAAGVQGRSVDDFLKVSGVETQTDSDLLRFTVTDNDPKAASRLASAYASAYTAYRLELDTAAIQQARLDLEKRIASLKASKGGTGSSYESLVANDEKLRTMEALLTSNALVVRAGDAAVKVSPRPARTVIFAVALALVLGIGLAFLAEALDTRVRVVDEVGRRLGLTLLARLAERGRRQRRVPLPVQPAQSAAGSLPVQPAQSAAGSLPAQPAQTAAGHALAMLEDPTSVDAEAYRVLRANFDFVNAKCGARCIMVTSAVEGEGKSETVANLALAFARYGRRVALVDLDLRRPTLHRLFALVPRPGVTDVVAGVVELDKALVRVPLELGGDGRSGERGNRHTARFGTLDVLPAGTSLPEAGEFMGTPALGEVLRDLAGQVDLVLVDTPALLRVGDAMALSAHVDALLVVVRIKAMRRPILKELRRVLDACPAPKLGYVVTYADDDLGYAYSGKSQEPMRGLGSIRLPRRPRVAIRKREASEWT